MGLEPANWE